MKLRSLFIVTIVLSLLSCRKEDSDSIIIKAGFVCGWGAGQDDLEITSKTIRYIYYVPRQSPEPLINESHVITENEWKEILSALDISEFVELNYNSCNVCADGCDEWISIDTGDKFHQVKYAKGLEIEEIKELQQIISRIKSEFH